MDSEPTLRPRLQQSVRVRQNEGGFGPACPTKAAVPTERGHLVRSRAVDGYGSSPFDGPAPHSFAKNANEWGTGPWVLTGGPKFLGQREPMCR